MISESLELSLIQVSNRQQKHSGLSTLKRNGGSPRVSKGVWCCAKSDALPHGRASAIVEMTKNTAVRLIVLASIIMNIGITSYAQSDDGALHALELTKLLKTSIVTPIIRGLQVTFVYRGRGNRVEVVGDFTNWRPRGHVLSEADGTGARHYTHTFAATARVEYKFIVDGEWTIDPLNPQQVNNGVGGFNSFITMPEYRPTPFADEARVERGTLLKAVMPNRGNRPARKISVYLPHGYDGSPRRYPVLYLQDGTDYIMRGHAVQIANNLIARAKVKPFIIVFVDPADRIKEYWANDAFSDFVATELVPFVDARFRTRADRDKRALLGASLGGVISVWTALRHPELFARVGGQSSAFWIDNERVVTALAALDAAAQQKHPMRFYFDVGRLEPILDVNRRVRALLTEKGYAVVYRESEAGHNFTTWRDGLADAYVALWKDEL